MFVSLLVFVCNFVCVCEKYYLSQEASWLWLTSKLTLLTGCLAWMFTLQGGELCLLSFVPTTCVHISLCCTTRVHISDFISGRRRDNLTLHSVPPPGSGAVLAAALNIMQQVWFLPSLSTLSLSSACLCLVRVPIEPTCSMLMRASEAVILAFALLNSCYWGNTDSKSWSEEFTC